MPQNHIASKGQTEHSKQNLSNYRTQTSQLNKAKNLTRIIQINQHSSVQGDVKTNKHQVEKAVYKRKRIAPNANLFNPINVTLTGVLLPDRDLGTSCRPGERVEGLEGVEP